MTNQSMFNEIWNSVLPGAAGVKDVGPLFWQASEARRISEAALSQAQAARVASENVWHSVRHGEPGKWNAGQTAMKLYQIALDAAAAKATAVELKAENVELKAKLDLILSKLDATHPGTTP